DPLLTCRLEENCRTPLRVIIDSHLRIPRNSRIVQTACQYPTLIFCCSSPPADRQEDLSGYGLDIREVPPDSEGRVDLSQVLTELGSLGIESLFVEGGSAVITSFLKLRLVDTLYLVCAPMIIGRGIEAVGDLHTQELAGALRGTTRSVRQEGEDIIWEIDFREDAGSRRNGSAGRTARALYFTAPRTVALREEAIHRQPGEILIHSQAIAVSHGTEKHLYNGTFPGGSSMDGLKSLAGEMEYPVKYGYMNAGLTEDGRRVFAFFPHQDLFYIQEKELIEFPESFSFEDIVLYPSVETAYTVLLDAWPQPGDRILIVGLGMIGLLCAEMLSEWTGLHIAAVDPDRSRREHGGRLGVQCLTPEPSDPGRQEELIRTAFGGSLPDKTIHLSGTDGGLQLAIDSTAFEGTVIEASWHGGAASSLKLGEAFHRRRLTVRCSQVSHVPGDLGPRWDRSRRTGEVKEWMERIRPSKYITRRYPLEKAPDAFRDIFEGGAEILQALLLPHRDDE
ncbi:MAG: dihydrofolate reductase family protein, partial [Sediminispirochaetaceae bacterium]